MKVEPCPGWKYGTNEEGHYQFSAGFTCWRRVGTTMEFHVHRGAMDNVGPTRSYEEKSR